MVTPIILREGSYTKEELAPLEEQAFTIKDLYASQLSELFEIENPSLIFKKDFKQLQKVFLEKNATNNIFKGDWVYFPWSKTLIRMLSEADFKKVLTARNKNLITEEEQEKLFESTISLTGLSVGSGIAATLAHMGIGGTFKIADFDTLDTSNLNRVRTGLTKVGEKKLKILTEELFEINPYITIIPYEEGLSDDNLKDFVKDTDIIFEIIDDFKMKMKLRFEARKRRVPLMMLTNLQDSVLIDIERYDREENLPIFNGRIGNLEEEILSSEISKEDEKRFAIGIVGKENLPERLLASVQDIGKTLVGRPQLASTVSIGSGMAAYFARKIVLREGVPSGRTLVTFDSFIEHKK